MSFWGELKRRNVYKVGVAYAIVAWLIVQASAIVFPHLDFPAWTVPFVIVLLIIGFPLILLFAWAFEITPEGIKRTKEVPLTESITHLTGQKLNSIVTGLLVLAVSFLAVKVFFLDKGIKKTDVVSTKTDQAPVVADVEEAPKTIAVLPFSDLSPEKDQEYFVDGLSEEILNSLAQIQNLNVIGRTSSFSFKGSNKTVQEIASVLGVENILEGSVRKAGNALRITAQLLRATDGVHLWSGTYDREFKDIFAVQEDIATAVANELKVTLGIDRYLKKLGGTENLEAYELYLVALGQAGVPTYTAFSQALESIDAAIALDPEFALAWAMKSFFHHYLSVMGPAKRNALEREEALQAALKAIEIEPNLAAGHYQLGWMKTTGGEFIEAELVYRKAFEMTTEHFSSAFEVYPLHYFAVGYFVKANKLIEEYLQKNRLDQNMRNFYILTFDILGNMQRAEEEYKLCLSLFGDQWVWGKLYMTFVRLGAGDIGSRDEIPEIPMLDPIWANAREHFESPEEGLEELHRFYEESNNLYNWPYGNIMMWAAYFGDPEFAMEVVKKELSLNSQSMIFVWLPVMREVRQTPQFKELVREIGLVDYWNEFGWPDICRPLDNGDFECD